MKPTDLQIGDWVEKDMNYSEEDPLYTKLDYRPYQIMSGEDIDLACETNCIGDADVYQPIPLTKEILEKSGFYFGYTSDEEDLASNTIAQLSEEDKGWVWDEGDGSIKVILPNESDGGMIIIDDQSFDRHLSLVYNNEVYVHEVQHALRICGLNELADNLKME